jgi:RNA polymerase sigma-70 factor, ECF subfamily
MPEEPPEFTVLLREWSGGNKAALDQISSVLYQELRRLAAAKLNRERSGHTLQPTALIHEAYLRLVHHDQDQWHSRAHFFSVASHIMREILVDHARKHHAAKRAGGAERVTLDEAVMFAPERGSVLVALDDALTELAGFDERKGRLIELKYFGGLETDELAAALGISRSTVTRESRLAEAWLYNRMAAPQ